MESRKSTLNMQVCSTLLRVNPVAGLKGEKVYEV